MTLLNLQTSDWRDWNQEGWLKTGGMRTSDYSMRHSTPEQQCYLLDCLALAFRVCQKAFRIEACGTPGDIDMVPGHKYARGQINPAPDKNFVPKQNNASIKLRV